MWKKVFVFSLCLCLLFACGSLFASAEEGKYMVTDTYSPWPGILINGNHNTVVGQITVDYENGILDPGFVHSAKILGNNEWETGAFFKAGTDVNRASCVLRLPMPDVVEYQTLTTYLRFTIWVYQPYKLNSRMQYPLDNLSVVYITKSDGTTEFLTEYTQITAVGMSGAYGALPVIEGYNKWDAWTGYVYEYQTTEKFEGDFSIRFSLGTSDYIDSTEGKGAFFGMSPVQIQQWADSAADAPLYPENDGSNEVSELENAEQGALDSLGGTQNVDNQMTNALNAIEQLQTLSVGFSMFVTFFDRFFFKLPIVYILITIAVGLGLFGSLLGVVGNYVGRIQSDARADRRASRTVVTRSKTTKDKRTGVRTTVSQRRYK